jgi:hypothetical protein
MIKRILIYTIATVVGIALFIASHIYATRLRGYIGYGGELVFLFAPALVWMIRACMKTPEGEEGDDL